MASCLTEIAPAADAAGTAGVPTSQPADGGRIGVSAVVAGIVGYTRWPSEASSIRLCTLGQGPGVEELLTASARLGSAQRPVSVHALAGADDSNLPCDAVYIGAPAGGGGREALKRLAGRPVLVLGEGADFCSDGGMFCLAPGAGTVRFNANLDAIARSGLRINPQVLRIARGAAGGGS